MSLPRACPALPPTLVPGKIVTPTPCRPAALSRRGKHGTMSVVGSRVPSPHNSIPTGPSCLRVEDLLSAHETTLAAHGPPGPGAAGRLRLGHPGHAHAQRPRDAYTPPTGQRYAHRSGRASGGHPHRTADDCPAPAADRAAH